MFADFHFATILYDVLATLTQTTSFIDQLYVKVRFNSADLIIIIYTYMYTYMYIYVYIIRMHFHQVLMANLSE